MARGRGFAAATQLQSQVVAKQSDRRRPRVAVAAQQRAVAAEEHLRQIECDSNAKLPPTLRSVALVDVGPEGETYR
jgi:hypothetical protein